MTVNELIEQLESARDAGFGDLPVMLATQPSYPLASTLKAVMSPLDLASEEGIEDQVCVHETDPDTQVYSQEESGPDVCDDVDYGCVWLVEGGSRSEDPYANKRLW